MNMSWIENPGVDNFDGLNISDLTVDEAWLTVSILDSPGPLWLYSLSGNCHDCPFQRVSTNPIFSSSTPKPMRAFKISSQYPSAYRLRTDGHLNIVSTVKPDPWSFCQVDLDPGEFGVYDLSVNASQKCSMQILLDPVNIYLPLLILVLSYLTMIIATVLVTRYKEDIKRLFSWIFPSCSDHLTSTSTSSEALLLPPETTSVSSSDVNSSSDDVGIRPRARGRRKKSKRGVQNKAQEENNRTSVSPEESLPSTSSRVIVAEQPVRERFASLDAFRGFCIVIMIFVDDNAGHYHFFEHSTWDGLNLADVAFPWFLFIMGTCVPISILAQKRRQIPKSTILQKIISRSIKLALIGIFIINTSGKSSPAPLGKVRIPGVLQRFGICYFVVSILVLYFIPEDSTENSETTPSNRLKNILWKNIPWIFVILCVILHSCIIFFLPVPGCPTGYFGPGGLHLDNKYPSGCVGGATGYIDRLLFTPNHIYGWPTPKQVYGSGPFDPEGVLGLLPSILQTWLGVQAGFLFLQQSSPAPLGRYRLKYLLAWSLICLITGLILCGGNIRSGFPLSFKGWIPVNKNLWSLSFVLVTSGLAFLLLAIFYGVIDILGWASGFPFLEAGMNSILLYMGHEIFGNSLPWNFSWARMSTHWSHLVENLWGTGLWVGIAVYFYRRKWFLIL